MKRSNLAGRILMIELLYPLSFLVRHMHTGFISLMLAALALCGVVACKPISQAEIKSHFARGGSHDWLFVPGGRIDFNAHTAMVIRQWLTAHDTGWKSAALDDFDPAKTQLLTDDCAVEIDGNRIVVTFERVPDDTDTTIYIQRPLSSDERLFWSHVIEQIKRPNQSK